MGDWNQTCGISRLAIQPGDRIALLILRPTEDVESFWGGSGFYNSRDIFEPISFILRGVYTNYGLAKLDNNEFARNFLLNYTVSQSGMLIDTLDELLVIINRGEIKLSYMMFHEELLDILLESVGNRNVYKSDLNFRSMLIEVLNNYKNSKDENNYIYMYLQHLNYSIFPKLLNKAIEENLSVDKDFIDLIILDRLFQFSRLYYFPQSGVGSQTNEFQVHLDISHFIINKANRYIEENYSAEDNEFINEVLETTLFLPFEEKEEIEEVEDIQNEDINSDLDEENLIFEEENSEETNEEIMNNENNENNEDNIISESAEEQLEQVNSGTSEITNIEEN